MDNRMQHIYCTVRSFHLLAEMNTYVLEFSVNTHYNQSTISWKSLLESAVPNCSLKHSYIQIRYKFTSPPKPTGPCWQSCSPSTQPPACGDADAVLWQVQGFVFVFAHKGSCWHIALLRSLTTMDFHDTIINYVILKTP